MEKVLVPTEDAVVVTVAESAAIPVLLVKNVVVAAAVVAAAAAADEASRRSHLVLLRCSECVLRSYSNFSNLRVIAYPPLAVAAATVVGNRCYHSTKHWRRSWDSHHCRSDLMGCYYRWPMEAEAAGGSSPWQDDDDRIRTDD